MHAVGQGHEKEDAKECAARNGGAVREHPAPLGGEPGLAAHVPYIEKHHGEKRPEHDVGIKNHRLDIQHPRLLTSA